VSYANTIRTIKKQGPGLSTLPNGACSLSPFIGRLSDCAMLQITENLNDCQKLCNDLDTELNAQTLKFISFFTLNIALHTDNTPWTYT